MCRNPPDLVFSVRYFFSWFFYSSIMLAPSGSPRITATEGSDFRFAGSRVDTIGFHEGEPA